MLWICAHGEQGGVGVQEVRVAAADAAVGGCLHAGCRYVEQAVLLRGRNCVDRGSIEAGGE